MPYERKPFQYKRILSYEEIIRVVRVASMLGIRKVRLTGGEPLMRKNIIYLVEQLAKIDGVQELTLTTNGVLLYEMADDLKNAGLNRVNISLDSLNPSKYSHITNGGDIHRVLKGIEKAKAVGLEPVKINVVIVKGINNDEIVEFAKLTLLERLHVRFIEFMPGTDNDWDFSRVVTAQQIRATLEKEFELEPIKIQTSGPAKHWKIKGAQGIIGFISALSEHFCNECNRLRLTSDGRLRPCLFSPIEVDLKELLRKGCSDKQIQELFIKALFLKPEGHYLMKEHIIPRPMSEIGG